MCTTSNLLVYIHVPKQQATKLKMTTLWDVKKLCEVFGGWVSRKSLLLISQINWFRLKNCKQLF